jgi:hypothetical protein
LTIQSVKKRRRSGQSYALDHGRHFLASALVILGDKMNAISRDASQQFVPVKIAAQSVAFSVEVKLAINRCAIVFNRNYPFAGERVVCLWVSSLLAPA